MAGFDGGWSGERGDFSAGKAHVVGPLPVRSPGPNTHMRGPAGEGIARA